MEKKNKIFLSVAVLILVLIGVRIALPHVGKWYINDTLKNGVGGYYGEIKDLDILLIAGRYTIRGLELNKIVEGEVNPQDNPPFLSIAEMKFHVFWRALFNGYLRGTLDVNRAVVNVIHNPQGASQTGAEEGGEGFLPTADALFPLNLEDIRITNSKIRFINPAAEPPIDLSISDIELVAENITNTREIKKTRASSLRINANTPTGKIYFDSHFNPLSEALSFDVDTEVSFEDLTPLNPFFLYYANFDVQKGRLSVASEVNGDEECLQGYVKPVFEDLEITEAGESYESFSNFFTEQALGLVNLVIRNYPKDQTATKVEFAQAYKGDFNIDTWKSVGNLFKNAFIRAFDPNVDNELRASSQPKNCKRRSG